jgi:hypothetical protein
MNMDVNFEKLNDNELIEILDRLNNYEEAASALTELKARSNEIYLMYAQRILINSLGDEFLQASAFEKLYDGKREEAVDILRICLDKFPIAVLAAAMDSLTVDGFEELEPIVSSDLLKSLAAKYESFGRFEKELYSSSFEWFKETFKNQLC